MIQPVGTGAFRPIKPERIRTIAQLLGIKLVKVKGGRDYTMSTEDEKLIRKHLKTKSNRRKSK